MAFDIQDFYAKNKNYYGDVPLEDVAKDAFSRFGMDKKYAYDDWKQQTGIVPAIEEDTYQREAQKARTSTPGILGELGRSLGRGVTQTVPQSIGKGLQWVNPDEGGSQTLEDMGRSIEQFGDKNAKRFPGLTMSQEAEQASNWNPRKWVANAGESIAQSVTPMIVGGAVGALAGPIVGAASGLGALGGMFYGGTAEDTYRKAIQKGLSPDDAKSLAHEEGLYEGGGELIADLIPIPIFRGLGKAAKGTIIKTLTARQPAKDMLKGVLKTIAGEELTESGQQAAQTYADQRYGITDQGIIESVSEVWGPTLITSLLFGAGGVGYNTAHRANLRKALTDPSVDVENRLKSLNEVAKAAHDIDPEVGKNFYNQGLSLLKQGKPITIDDDQFYITPASKVDQGNIGDIGGIPAPGESTLDPSRTVNLGNIPTPPSGPITGALQAGGLVGQIVPGVPQDLSRDDSGQVRQVPTGVSALTGQVGQVPPNQPMQAVSEFQPTGPPSTAEEAAQVLYGAKTPAIDSAFAMQQEGVDSPYYPELDTGEGAPTEITPRDIKSLSLEDLQKARPAFEARKRPDIISMIDGEIAEKKNKVPEHLRQIFGIMREESQAGGIESLKDTSEGGKMDATTAVGRVSSHAEWFQDLNKEIKNRMPEIGGIDKVTFDRILTKKETGQPLTDRQGSIWKAMEDKAEEYNGQHPDAVLSQDEARIKKMGYDPNHGQEVKLTDLAPGDKVLFGDEEFHFQGFDDQGQIVFQDGEKIRLDPFESITPDGIKRTEKPGKAELIKEERRGASGIQGMVDTRRDVLNQDARMQAANLEPRGERRFDPIVRAKIDSLTATSPMEEVQQVADMLGIPKVGRDAQGRSRTRGMLMQEIIDRADQENMVRSEDVKMQSADMESRGNRGLQQKTVGTAEGLAAMPAVEPVSEVQAGEQPTSTQEYPGSMPYGMTRKTSEEKDQLRKDFEAEKAKEIQPGDIVTDGKRTGEMYIREGDYVPTVGVKTDDGYEHVTMDDSWKKITEQKGGDVNGQSQKAEGQAETRLLKQVAPDTVTPESVAVPEIAPNVTAEAPSVGALVSNGTDTGKIFFGVGKKPRVRLADGKTVPWSAEWVNSTERVKQQKQYAPGSIFIGVNPNGDKLYQDEKGKRYRLNEAGTVRMNEPVRVVMSKSGISGEIDRTDRPEWQTAEEVSKQSSQSAPETKPEAQGEAISQGVALPPTPQTTVTQHESIKAAIAKERPGIPVEISELRKQFSEMSKADFDAEILSLAKAKTHRLHKHAHPAQATEAEKSGMIPFTEKDIRFAGTSGENVSGYYYAINPRDNVKADVVDHVRDTTPVVDQKAPVGEPQKPKLTFDEFEKKYREAFKNMSKYRIDQAGSNIYADEMAKLSEEYPGWADRVEQKKEPPKTKATESVSIAKWVSEQFGTGKKFTWMELFEKANEAFGGVQSQGAYTSKDAYDAMELGVNQFILENKLGMYDPNKDQRDAHFAVTGLKARVNTLLPTQTKRTAEQDEFQQFSTPPQHAYVAAWVANIGHGDVVFEPSAGVGGLASFAKNANPKAVYVNELSPRRANLLDTMGFDRVYRENAEQVNNILSKDVKPTVIIMNPPFSATAGRMQGQRRTENATQHIDQALAMLQPGGRMVAIVGEGMREGAPTFIKWWNKTKSQYTVRANVGINGSEYAKYGTTFNQQILVIDKLSGADYNTITGNVDKVEDLLPLLNEVRNERRQLDSGQEGKLEGNKPAIGKTDQEGRPVSGTGDAVLPSTGTLGSGERPSGHPPDQAGINGVAGNAAIPLESVESDGDAGGRRGPDNVSSGTTQDQRGRSAGSSDTDTGATGQPTVSEGERVSSSDIPEELQIVSSKQDVKGEVSDDNLYEGYSPEKITIAGAKKHPTPLVQSAAMASVSPPTPTYKPRLPKFSVTSGKISDIQIEAVIYAGQAHGETLPSGDRKGFFIGDSTGVGKGREIAAIFWDNWQQGRKKGIWISEKKTLFKDAQRDVSGVGWKPETIFDHGKIKADAKIKSGEGILFTTYDTLKSGSKVRTDKEAISRLNQIVDWLGEDFDGVIAFDESHNMGNSLSVEGARGKTKPAEKALAGIEFQKRLPNARVVYVSATGATDVVNLAYCDRLGLWGEGTPFPNKKEFINAISQGGTATMEMVAQNMKASGVYTARSLSYDGVTYDRIEHVLSEPQRQIYDKLAEGWQVVLKNINEALAMTGVTSENEAGGTTTRNGGAKSAALSAFWGSHQRFFNQVITAMQTPSVINKMHADLKNGEAVIIQLVNTMEASQERAIAKLSEEDSLDDLDLTPRDTMMQLVQNSFPVYQYEEYTDENDNVKSRPVLDSEDNRVENPEAVAMRDRLLDELGSIKVPDSPIDMILNEFGVDNVAEITGRKRRVVNKMTPNGIERVLEKRGNLGVSAEADGFMNGKRNILIFSQAGGTGRSYHADLDAKNQKKRNHYLLQAGWRADAAVQGLGRSHRSNQKQPPAYFLVTTDLKGQKRFLSSIARRLDQLGALTKGQRETGSQGIFQARDNLESTYATDALSIFFRDLIRGNIDGLSVNDFQDQTGLKLVGDRGETLQQMPPIKQFLNRILSMKIEQQNKTFDEFSSRMDAVIKYHAENGTLDMGLETLKAKEIKKVDEQVVYTDPKTGATTRYVNLELTHDRNFLNYDSDKKLKYYTNNKSERIWSVAPATDVTNAKTGEIESVLSLISPTFTKQKIEVSEFSNEKWTLLSNKEAKAIWNEEIRNAPKTYTDNKHIVTGLLLPIWDRLSGYPRLMKVQTNEGERMIGRLIAPSELASTLKNLNANNNMKAVSPADIHSKIIDDGAVVKLANGWTISRRMVSGDQRIELKGPNYSHMGILGKYGVFQERIQFDTRNFIPSDQSGIETIAKIIEHNPVVDIKSAKGGDISYSDTATPPTEKLPGRVTVSRAKSEFKTLIDNLNAKGDVSLIFASDPSKIIDDELRRSVMDHEQNSGRWVRGFFHKKSGTLYVFTDRMGSMKDVAQIVSHELIGHFGLYEFMGSELQPFFDFVLQHPEYSEQIKQTARDRGIDVSTGIGRYTAAKEWWAELVEKGDIEPSLWTRFVMAFKNALRRMGIRGELLVGFSKNDIAEIIRGSMRAVEGKGGKYGEGGLFGKTAMDFADVFHGTPHVWPPEPGFPHGRPRLDKVGEGQGAASFGYGWYSAESEEVGSQYKNELSSIKYEYNGIKYPTYDTLPLLKSIYKEHQIQPEDHMTFESGLDKGLKEGIEYFDSEKRFYSEEYKKAESDYQRTMYQHLIDKFDKFSNIMSEIKEVGGALYKLDLPDSVLPRLLDWDKKLSEQSEYVQGIIKKEKPEFFKGLMSSLKGRDFYHRLSDEDAIPNTDGNKAASEYLASIGIPGNKYLDQMSRPGVQPRDPHMEKDGGRWVVFAAGGQSERWVDDEKAASDFLKTLPKAEKRKQTSNYVIWSQPVLNQIALLERNGEKLDAIRGAEHAEYADTKKLNSLENSDISMSKENNGMDNMKNPIELFHASPNKIVNIDPIKGRFGSYLFFSGDEDAASSHNYINDQHFYKIELSSDDIVDAGHLYYEEDAYKLEKLTKDLADDLEVDVDTAEELISGRESLWDVLGDNKDSSYISEKSWDIQKITAQAATILGYRGVALPDEHGTSYMIDMKGREKELRQLRPKPPNEPNPRIDYSDTRITGADAPIHDYLKARETAAAKGSATWKEPASDISQMDMIFKQMLYYAPKVPALKKMYDAAGKYLDNKTGKQREILYSQDGKMAYPKELERIEKANKEQFKTLGKYLVTLDMAAKGYKVKQKDEHTEGGGVRRTFILVAPKEGWKEGTFSTEAAAWKAAIEYEADAYAQVHPEAHADIVKALTMFRTIGHNMYDMLHQSMEDLLAEYEKSGQPIPEISFDDASTGKKVRMTLKKAMAEMGDIRGSYFPRTREPGAFTLIAKKGDANPILEKFDIALTYKNEDSWMSKIPLPINRRAAELKKQGYDVTMMKSDALPESVFLELSGQSIALESLLTKAFDQLNANQEHSLKDMGIQSKWDGKDFVISGEGIHAKTHPAVLQHLGGEYEYVEKKGQEGYPSIRFSNAKESIADEVKDTLLKHAQSTFVDTMFGNSLITTIADIFKARGGRSGMVARHKGVGVEVWKGYEEEPITAFTRASLGIAGATAKGELARQLHGIITGRTESWAEYQQRIVDTTPATKASYAEYQKEVEARKISATKQPNAYKLAQSYTQNMLRNDEAVDRVVGVAGGLAVLKYLWGRPGAVFVNLTNMAAGVPGSMLGHAGIPLNKTFGLIGKAGLAYKDYKFGDGKSLNKWTLGALEHIEKNGWDQAQYNQEAMAPLKGKFGRAVEKIMEYGMLGFSVSEKINRVSTILGTYMGIKEAHKGLWGETTHLAALEKAKEVSDKAHGVYGDVNRPYLAQGGGVAGNLAKSFFMFKTFSHNYVLNMIELGFKKEIKAMSYLALAPAIMAGASATVLAPIIKAACMAFGVDDPEEEFYAWIEKEMGAGSSMYARTGLLGLGGNGPALKGSLSIGMLDLPTSIADLLGAPGGIVKDLADGAKAIGRGDLLKGAEKILPNAVAGPARAYRESTEGMTTTGNAPRFFGDQQVKLTGFEAAMRALSFNPARIAVIQDIQRGEYKAKELLTKQRSEIYSRARRAIINQDQDEYADVLARMNRYNLAINGNDRYDGYPELTWKKIMQNARKAQKPSKLEKSRQVEL